MFIGLHLENFKSFKSFESDFSKKDGVPRNTIIIYGENGSGKSNLVYAFEFLQSSMSTLGIASRLTRITESMDSEDSNSEEKALLKNKLLLKFIKESSFPHLAKDAAMIGSQEDSLARYEFVLNGIPGFYEIEFNRSKVKREVLYYKLSRQRGVIFELSEEKVHFSEKAFIDKDFLDDLKKLIRQYWGQHSFMSILTNEVFEKNDDYIDSALSSNLTDVIFFLNNFSYKCKTENFDRVSLGSSYQELFSLKGGVISEEDSYMLDTRSKILSEYLSSLYADIVDVGYDLEENNGDSDKIEYSLYIEKIIGGEVRKIPVNKESNGTQSLISIMSPFIEAHVGNVAIIDEADAGIHDLLFNELMKNIMSGISGQLIITTHNTTLLDTLKGEDRKNVYFLDVDIDGNKDLFNIGEYGRIQKNINLRHKYLDNVYGGVPQIGALDFNNIASILERNSENGKKNK